MSLILRTLNRVIQKTAALHSVSEPTQRICKAAHKIYLFNETRRKLNIKVKYRRILQESGFIEISPAAKIVNVMREMYLLSCPVSEDIV
jgi:hypothetical protein